MPTLKLTKKYNHYLKYKDSGVEWVGEIPIDWEVGKVKQYFKRMERPVVPDSDVVTAFRDGTVTLRSKRREDGFTMSDKEIGYQGIEKGDLVVHAMDAFAGAIGVSDSDGKSTPVYSALRSLGDTDVRYYMYLLRHMSKSQYIFALAKGIRERSTEFRYKELASLIVTKPQLDLQQKIAIYLDEKTALIDTIIEKKKKQIELLREKRAAIINRAVTEIEGKEERLKHIVRGRKSVLEKAPQGSKYVGLENVESGTGRHIEANENDLPEGLVDIFRCGDVLFGKLRPYLAKVLAPDFDGVCTGELLVLVPNIAKVRGRYLFYKLISRDFIKAVDDSTYGSKMPRANWQFIGNMRVVYPPLDEQDKIIEGLDSKLTLIHKIGETLSESITLLQEFKSALISHVVTGKVKV